VVLVDEPVKRRLHRPNSQGREADRLAGGATTRVELFINLKTAKALGLTIPLPLPQVEFRSRMPWWDCRCRGILAPSAIIASW
jgi:hypothetical protein